ncbi:MAG: hypothetical protein WAK69_20005 [Rhodoplanes sp.]
MPVSSAVGALPACDPVLAVAASSSLRVVAFRGRRGRGFFDLGCPRSAHFVVLGAITSRGGRLRGFIIRGFARRRWRL